MKHPPSGSRDAMAIRRIGHLPPQVIERIAAGEVIERPASVARELVENALDAGATTIRVEIRDGGLRSVRAADDGSGILPDDLELACLPHTTSKLSALADLEAIETLGFRGEALASIAAVADVEIVSAADDGGLARSIAPAGRTTAPVSTTARPRGTTVTVRGLFAEMPARRALLRRPAGEAARVWSVVRAYALIHPWVAFTLVSDGAVTLQTHGNGLDGAIQAIYGSDLARALVPFGPVASGDVSGEGVVSPPPFEAVDRQQVILAINGRPVANRLLQSAMEAGYRSLLRKGRHPVLVASVTAPPTAVDANVHPAKADVLLRDEQALAAMLRAAVANALGSAKAIAQGAERRSLDGRALTAVQLRLPAPRKRRGLLLGESKRLYSTPGPRGEAARDVADDIPELEPLGQLDDALIVARTPSGHLYLVDQHRAHERILYDEFVRFGREDRQAGEDAEAGGEATVESAPGGGQMLLMPILVELTQRQAVLLLPRLDELAAMGFECQHFGGAAFLVRALPSLTGASAEPGALARGLAQDAAEDSDDWLEHVRASLACRSAIRRGQPLSLAEQAKLLRQLCGVRTPARCPHGSPLLLRYSKTYLTRAFEW